MEKSAEEPQSDGYGGLETGVLKPRDDAQNDKCIGGSQYVRT